MKTRRLIDIIIAVLFVTAITTAMLPAQERLPYKSAIVKYRISGDYQSGEMEMYIDDYGEKRCTIMKVDMAMGDIDTSSHTMMIFKGNDVYNINLKDRTGTKATMTPEQKEQMMQMAQQMSEEAMKSRGDMIGTETILGKPCEIYEISGMKIWIWNGLNLKSETSMMGYYCAEAVSLKVDTRIPTSQFEPPSGITIVEQPAGMPAGFGFGEYKE